VGIVLLVGCSDQTIRDVPPLAIARLSQRAQDSFNEVARRYGIEIVTKPKFPMNGIRGEAPDVYHLENFAPLFAAEFSIYPVDLVRKCKLKKIILCRNLSSDGGNHGGLCDYNHGALFVTVGDITENQHSRMTIHHEFFHLIDLSDDGHIFVEENWKSLNSPRFQYGGYDFVSPDPPSQLDPALLPGFVTPYCMVSVLEDKAELFTNMVAEPDMVKNRVAGDSILRAKVEFLKHELQGFCPEMNDAFWERRNHRK
jgi:hypothetical protein